MSKVRLGAGWRQGAAIAAAAGLGLITAGCSSISSSSNAATGASGAATGPASATASTAACSNAAIQADLHAQGQLTVATDSPAYPPWFINNKPGNGQGYESAVTYAVAKQLGFTTDQVKWVTEP